MEIQINGKPSISSNGKRAQVTIVTGEGRNRRSVTRHAVRGRLGGWFGLNPDPRAIPLNERYEQELAEAKSNLTSAKAAMEGLRKRLEVVGDVDPSKVDEIGIAAAKAMLDGMIKTIALEIYAAEFLVDDAKSKLAMVQEQCPLQVEFIGDHL